MSRFVWRCLGDCCWRDILPVVVVVVVDGRVIVIVVVVVVVVTFIFLLLSSVWSRCLIAERAVLVS